jgi:uncharacterized protein YutE (UPF0331/DUF86 family)
MNSMERESIILERVREELVAEGFDVVLEPNDLLLPNFLRGFRPDALAFGEGKNLVVEIASSTPRSKERVKVLQTLIADQPDWDLRIIWTSPDSGTQLLQALSPEEIHKAIDQIDDLILSEQNRAALLLAWASFEAVGRILQPRNLGKPQTPARLVQQLATAGILLPTEADNLNLLISKRNRLVHGDLRVEASQSDILFLVHTLRRILDEASEGG